MDYKNEFLKLGISVPNILLPANGVDLERFSVIACDQFSAEPSYWYEVSAFVGDQPSALNLMLPEAHLQADNSPAIAQIHQTMAQYNEQELLKSVGEGFVYVERKTKTGLRKGLVVALDLEQYQFSNDSTSLIRATEKTVVERLPARIKIRDNAPIEMSHVLVLLDDAKDLVIGSIEKHKAQLPLLYDFPLMMGGGHITGYHVSDPSLYQEIIAGLNAILATSDGMLYAMGDGNHSFAAAKACWEQIKSSLSIEEQENHPARFSLVELVNLHDDGVYFEPIHRLIAGVDGDALQRELSFDANNPPSLQTLQPMLDAWLEAHPEAEIEYIHGAEQCRLLAQKEKHLAIIFPDFDKATLFDIVRRDGCFVRKSFSIGHAEDKRYYLECRNIR